MKKIITAVVFALLSVPALACSFCASGVSTQISTTSTAYGPSARAWGESFVSGLHVAPNGMTQFQGQAGHLAYGSGVMTGTSGIQFSEVRSSQCTLCGSSVVQNAGHVFSTAYAYDPVTHAYGQLTVQGVHQAPNGFTNFGYTTGFEAFGSWRADGSATGQFSEQRLGGGTW
jgi:hypothetical protein